MERTMREGCKKIEATKIAGPSCGISVLRPVVTVFVFVKGM